MKFGRQQLNRSLYGAVLALAALGSTAAAAHAQSVGSSGNNLITINPLGLPFKYFSGELERKVSPMATLGASLSFIDVEDVQYFTTEAKLRLYPNEEAFKGFSVGIGAGLAHLSEEVFDSSDDNEATRPTISVIADYNWLLGKSKRFLVGAGVGAKRIFGSDDDFNDVNFAYPTARFQIGLVF